MKLAPPRCRGCGRVFASDDVIESSWAIDVATNKIAENRWHSECWEKHRESRTAATAVDREQRHG